MLLLPAIVTAREATDTLRLLGQAIESDAGTDVIVDASNLQQFDSSVLAVLLECHRAADAGAKSFALRNVSPKLAALAKLYGLDGLLLPAPSAPAAG